MILESLVTIARKGHKAGETFTQNDVSLVPVETYLAIEWPGINATTHADISLCYVYPP